MYIAAGVTLDAILNTPEDVEKTLEYFLTHELEGPKTLAEFLAEHKTDFPPEPSIEIEQLRAEIDSFDASVMEHFKKNPSEIHSLNGHQFSALVASILEDRGCEVQLGPQTRDGGYDILAAFKTPVGKVVTLVECKRYRPDRKIGVDILRNFLYVLREEKKAPSGIIATTSSFSNDAIHMAAKHGFQLQLKDFEAIKEWLSQYGKWTHKEHAGLWVPALPNVV